MNLPKQILIIGGTGALGSVLCQRIIKKDYTNIGVVTVFSRDEAKHHKLLTSMDPKQVHQVKSWIGDVRDYDAVERCIQEQMPDLVINCAAMKQVPLCEEFIYEAVQTNVVGTQNIKRAIAKSELFIPLVTISTDKAVKPINAYGHTKALQEKITLQGYAASCVVRYGNVLESTGSVIPYFKQLLTEGKSLPITDKNMTRFLLSLDDAVDLIFSAIAHEQLRYNKQILIPDLSSCYITDLAELLIEDHGSGDYFFTSPRPGEKLHEVLVAEHESARTWKPAYADHYVISNHGIKNDLSEEQFCSNHPSVLLKKPDLRAFLNSKGVIECKSKSQALRAS